VATVKMAKMAKMAKTAKMAGTARMEKTVDQLRMFSRLLEVH
jgi:hypothetical protein